MKKIASSVLACSLVFTLGSQAFAADEGVTQIKHGEEKKQNQNPEIKDINTIIEENKEYLTQGDIELSLKIIELKKEYPKLTAQEIVDLVFPSFQIYGLLSDAGKTWSNLTNEEKLLVALFPDKALLVKAAQSRTDTITNQRYPGWKDGDKGNAFRHALWNAMMSRDIGESFAIQFASAHENHGLTDAQYKAEVWNGFNGLQHKNMDLHNNQMGRDCFYWYDIFPLDSTLADRVDAKIKNGEAVILVK